MFDKITFSNGVGQRTTYVSQNTKVQEFRAPTDESVRLLGEMEQKVRSRIIESVKVNNNVFDCAYIILSPELCTNDHLLVAKVTINGEDLIIEEPITNYTKRTKNIREILMIIYKNVAEKIADDLMKRMVDTSEFKVLARER